MHLPRVASVTSVMVRADAATSDSNDWGALLAVAFEQAMVLLMGAVASLQTKRRTRSIPEPREKKSSTNSMSTQPFSISGKTRTAQSLG